MSRIAVAVMSVGFVLVVAVPALAWLDPNAPDVDVLLNDEDTQMLFHAGPNDQQEWLLNRGQSTVIRILGAQDPSILKWDASKLEPYGGKEILEAELHLCRYEGASTVNVVNALCAATINADWWEGSQSGGTAAPGDPCWRWRSMPVDPNNPSPTDEWTYTGSDFSTASFGNFGTLTCTGYKASDTFKQYTNGANYWIALKLDPAIVYAMILDNYGIVVTDPRGYDTGNPSIFSANQNATVQPRLYIKAGTADTTPTGDATNLSVSPGEWNGEIVFSFDAPSDPEDGEAFGYDVRYATHSDFATATKVERWRIPRPDESGASQQVFIEYLTAGQAYTFFVQAYDKAGNTGNVVQTGFTLPTAVPTPALADGGLATPDPSGKTIRTVGGVLNYWVCSELAKVNPLTGNRIADGYTGSGADDYKKANVVWDAGTNTVALRCARNEVAAFQVIVERLVGSLTNVSVSAGDLSGLGEAVISASDSVEFFKLHYVNEGGTPYPDAAIPLQSPFAATFDIPDGDTNPGGVNQSAWCDLYVPRDATPGTYTGALTLNCDQIGPVTIDLNVIVHDAVLPDWPTFVVDLNGYGNKWSSEASRYQVFQLCHKHRMVPNTLPYGWNGSTTTDRRPELTGSGPTTTVSSWTTFANSYGPFFDGSGFSPDHPTYPYHGPGEDTPIAYFYTTFHECWPVHIGDATWGFDADGMGHAYWNSLYDGSDSSRHEFYLESPDVLGAFPAGYGTGYSNVAQEFAQYAQDHNWGTAFQMYLNNKGTYKNTYSLWTLEEQYIFDDFRADRWFLGLCRDGVEAAGAPNAKWHWRIDTSTRWGQNWGELRDICNLRVVGSDIDWYYRQIRYRRHLEPQPDDFWYYFGGPMPSASLTAHSADFLQKWSHGLVGGIPYWDNFYTNWDNAEQLAIVPSGDSVPGHGYFDGRLATIRMKGMRFGQQLIEHLNLLADKPGWNVALACRALSDRYGDQSSYAYDPWGGDAYDGVGILDYYRLRADLVASLAEGPSLPSVAFDLTASDGDESVTPASLAVSLSEASAQTVTVDYTVTGGTATGGGVDYTLAAGTLTFDPNDVSETIDIAIVNDGVVESDETVEVTLSNPTGATLGANKVHTYTILDNDVGVPTVEFDLTASAGDESVTPASLAVSLSAASTQTVTVDYAVTGGDATGGGVDYTLAAGTLTFDPNDMNESINITIVDDGLVESDETVEVTLSNPTGATLGANTVHTYTINDNDTYPTVQFDLTGSSGDESVTPASLSISLSASYVETVTVDYAVTGGTATGGGVDYTLAAGTLTFDPNDVSKTIDISIVDDGEDESDETIEVTLSNPSNATLGANTAHTYTILDNDGVSPPGQASNPSPASGTTKVSRNAILSWTAGSGADSHDVYFGTNSNPGPSEFQGNQPGTTFDPGYLGKNTWYYWRIDEVNAGGTTTGVVWSFKTGAK